MGKKESPDERAARAVVAHSLNVRVIHYDDGSENNMVDALIKYPGLPDGALEVVGDHDAKFNALWSALKKIGHQTHVSGLRRGWVVVLSRQARVNVAVKALPSLLAGYEESGISDFRLNTHGSSESTVGRAALSAGVYAAFVGDHIPAGAVKLQAEGWSGSISKPGSLSQWVEGVLESQQDVVTKLAAHAGVTERHAFIWATISSDYAIQFGLENRDNAMSQLALAPPALPEGVTHVWVAGAASSQGTVAWFPERGWWRTPWIAPPVLPRPLRPCRPFAP